MRFINQALMRRFCAAACGLLWCAFPSFPQCDPDSNGYVYLHPAFANRNWGKAAYDSVTITIPDAVCASKPLNYDICGPAASAVAVYSTAANDLYLMNTQYQCPLPKPLCTSCFLDYLDPAKVTLNGVTLAQGSPLYLVKNPVYGGDSVKLLCKNSQKKVLAVSLSTSTLAVLHVDTLVTNGLQTGQEVFRIQGARDSAAQVDTAVWLLGSNGLMRYFPVVIGGPWTETNFDLGPGITDTVFCVNNGYAGTSTGAIYRNSGPKYVFDNQQVGAHAIQYISSRGAVGSAGTFLDYNGTSWTYRPMGTANYRFGNFINRWDGFGVELLDNQWTRTAVTYRLNPSSIGSTVPPALKDSVNRNPYSMGNPFSCTVTMNDPDASYSDFSLVLTNSGVNVNMKNNGTYTIGSIPPDSQCMVDSLRLTSGVITIGLGPSSVQVSAVCDLGIRDLSCPTFKCTRVAYPFVASHTWARNDTLKLTAGSDRLRIVNNAMGTVAASVFRFSGEGQGCITHKLAGQTLFFSVQQGYARKLTRIELYTVSGQTLARLSVGNQSLLSVPRIGSAGIVYARYFFSDGDSQCQSILLTR
jgi:hypothetical protein